MTAVGDNNKNEVQPTAASAAADGAGVEVGSERWKRDIEGPFRRLDPNPDAFELARLALCAVTIIPVRLVLIAAFVPTYYVCALCFMHLTPSRPWSHAVSILAIRMASRFLLFLMGYWKVDVKGMRENAGRKEEPRLFVSNHVGYVEILYFLWQLGPSFVMKRTCLHVPLIGDIAARIIDCVPVDNKGGKAGGSGSDAIAARILLMFGQETLTAGVVTPQQQQQGGELSSSSSLSLSCSSSSSSSSSGSHTQKRLQPRGTTSVEESWARGWKGNPLLVFPEGTTSNGSCLLRFKTGVFAGGMPVHPVTVKFDVRRFSPAFESIYFPTHTFRSLAEPVHRLSVEFLPRFDPTPEQRADRALYAKAVQQIFCESMDLPAANAGYAEKTQYHTYLREQFGRHPWGGLALLLPAPDRHREMLEGSNRGNNVGGGVPQGVGEGGGEGETRVGSRAEGAVPVGLPEGEVIPNGTSEDVGGGETAAVLRRRVS